jgi:hypothetical protein
MTSPPEVGDDLSGYWPMPILQCLAKVGAWAMSGSFITRSTGQANEQIIRLAPAGDSTLFAHRRILLLVFYSGSKCPKHVESGDGAA